MPELKNNKKREREGLVHTVYHCISLYRIIYFLLVASFWTCDCLFNFVEYDFACGFFISICPISGRSQLFLSQVESMFRLHPARLRTCFSCLVNKWSTDLPMLVSYDNLFMIHDSDQNISESIKLKTGCKQTTTSSITKLSASISSAQWS